GENFSIFLGGSDGKKQIPSHQRARLFPDGLCGDDQEPSCTGRCCYLRSGWSRGWSHGSAQSWQCRMEGSAHRPNGRRSALRRTGVLDCARSETTAATTTASATTTSATAAATASAEAGATATTTT